LVRFVTWLRFVIVVLAAAAPVSVAQFPPAPGTGPGLPETIEAIESARVTTRILYITAHPDDESAAVLTYLARGLHADVALLSLTRGEGGQNDLGPEQAPQLGLIRTQELLAATRGYGVKLFFTRARDFGYSKTPEETQKIWGDPVLEDMVRVIRTFRPTVVVNNFGGVHTGHGHHQTEGIWTPKAVQLAADPAYKLNQPAEEQNLGPWGDRKPVVVLDLDRGEKPAGHILPLEDISPLYGKSWREIGVDAFSNHRTQGITGFLTSPFFRRPVALKREDGAELDPAILAQPLGPLDEDYEVGNMGVDPLMRTVDTALVAARDAALRLDWKVAAHSLVVAGKKMDEVSMPSSTYQIPPPVESLVRSIKRKRAKIDAALALVAGLRLEPVADHSEIVSGETFTIRVESHYRQEVLTDLNKPTLEFLPDWSIIKEEPETDGSLRFTVAAAQNASGGARTKPRVISMPAKGSAPANPLLPEPPPLVTATQEADIEGYTFTVTSAVIAVHATSTRVDRVPPRIVPAYTLAVEPKQVVDLLTKPRKPFDVLLRVHSYSTQPGAVTVGLDVPRGWKATPPVAVKFTSGGDRYAHLTVTPPLKLTVGNYKISAYATRTAGSSRTKSERFTTSLEALPTMPTQFWSEPAQCVVHSFSANVPPNLRVGYITAENEPVPEALQRLDIHVEMLDAAALAFSNLSRFNAIVVGIRAYELRPDLPGANQRLLDYVSNGGTLVVQYQREFAWDRFQYAPYPAKINPPAGSPLPRITDENAAVKFLKPADPLLNRPNKIAQDDFKGWVQERGVYLWSQFDPNYTPLLSMHDPGEPDLNGELVYAYVGKGTYIYVGLAFFRQLPEGVPGAYRLFVNLLSAAHAR
jgi:LmbE family N-acetylglucosaminyl deacetylase